VTVSQAAALLAVSGDTVRNWIKRGTIPYIVLPHEERANREYRIPLQGLLSCLAGNYDLGADIAALADAARQIDPEVDVLARLSETS
jgi:excisionase family DNA binding protein